MKLKAVLNSWNQNTPMKLTSLAVAFVFWFIMLGRQDITLSRELEVQVMLAPNHVIANEVAKSVMIEVVGPRVALKRFSGKKEVYTLDLSSLKEGYHQVTLSSRGLNLPIGLELLGIRPKKVDAVIRKLDGGKNSESGERETKDTQ